MSKRPTGIFVPGWRARLPLVAAGLCLAIPMARAAAGGQRAASASKTAPRPISKAVPPEFAALAKRAEAAREANKLEEAITLYKQGLRLNPKWEEGWWYLGSLYYDGDKYSEALPAFHNLVALSPKYGPGLAMLGLCEFETKDYKNSLVHLQMARAKGIGNNPELVNVVRYHQGMLEILRGNFEGATELLSSLVSQGLVSDDVKVTLGLALLRVPLLPGQVDPSKDALIHEAGGVAMIIAVSDFDSADAAFKRLENDFPTAPFVHYAYGSMLASLSRYEEAEQQVREEIKLNPESSLGYMQLAFIYLKGNRYQEALPLAQKAVALAPQSFAAHYLVGRALLELGKTEDATKELLVARRLGPYSPEVRYNLARAYAKAHRMAEAAHERAEFERLSALERQATQRPEAQTSYRTETERGRLVPQEPAEPPPGGQQPNH